MKIFMFRKDIDISVSLHPLFFFPPPHSFLWSFHVASIHFPLHFMRVYQEINLPLSKRILMSPCHTNLRLLGQFYPYPSLVWLYFYAFLYISLLPILMFLFESIFQYFHDKFIHFLLKGLYHLYKIEFKIIFFCFRFIKTSQFCCSKIAGLCWYNIAWSLVDYSLMQFFRSLVFPWCWLEASDGSRISWGGGGRHGTDNKSQGTWL